MVSGIRAWGRHGVHEREQLEPQPFEVDVELEVDLADAGRTDDLSRTVDYGALEARVRQLVVERHFRLLEALGEAIAAEVLGSFPARAVVVRVRKPRAPLSGPVGSAGIEIWRSAGGPRAGATDRTGND